MGTSTKWESIRDDSNDRSCTKVRSTMIHFRDTFILQTELSRKDAPKSNPLHHGEELGRF